MKPESKINFKRLINNDIKYALDLVENITKDLEGKNEAIEIINDMQFQLREIKDQVDPIIFTKLQKAKEAIETTNVSVKIALYKLILDLKS